MSLKQIAGVVAVAGALAATGGSPGQTATLDDVKADGTLKCGINTGLPGFAYTDDAASGAASTSPIAGRWPRPCWATPTRSRSST